MPVNGSLGITKSHSFMRLQKESDCTTALHHAASPEAGEVLLAAGANSQAQDKV